MPHLVDGVRQIVVVLQEIKSAEPQQFEGDAHVAMVVKPVKHPDAQAEEKESDSGQICTHHSDGLSLHQAHPFLARSVSCIKAMRHQKLATDEFSHTPNTSLIPSLQLH